MPSHIVYFFRPTESLYSTVCSLENIRYAICVESQAECVIIRQGLPAGLTASVNDTKYYLYDKVFSLGQLIYSILAHH